ncbi:MAG: hypothetical protein GY694_21375, partial [Gammaproteobacteria bacterium]|nr:hypothetical protein [Gammaproteobacteria bacterium]
KDEHEFIVDINALRRWLTENRIEKQTGMRTTGELVFNKHDPIVTLSPKEREVLDTISVNLKVSNKGKAIADLIEELMGTGDHKKTWLTIAHRLDIPTRYMDCGTPPKYKNDGKTPKLNHQRLMEISLMPTAIFYGVGKTHQEADDMASRCAMKYLQNQIGPGNQQKPEEENDIVIV